MKNPFFVWLALFVFIGLNARGQLLYQEVILVPEMMMQNADLPNTIRGNFKKANKNLDNIKSVERYINGKLLVINEYQKKIDKGLTQVSGTMRNAVKIKQIIDESDYILKLLSETARLVADHPQYSVFAGQATASFRRRVLSLYAQLSEILTENDRNYLDAGERQQILEKVYRELRLLRVSVFGINYSITSAVRAGFWNKLNPFSTWVNRDERIMRDIVRNARHITR